MAHQIHSMAYTGDTPWHELGNKLPPRQSIDVWAEKAGMNWSICQTPVRYMAQEVGTLGSIMSFDEQKVLYRSDTRAPLSVVSDRYQLVQPKEVLEFYRDLTDVSGFELETAGVLKGGRKFWALARTGKETVLKGNDLVTTATPTSVRVVCNNTLAVALNGAAQAIKVPHRTSFDAQAVKRQLGVAVTQWDSFMYRMKTLAERKVKTHESMNYFLKVLCQPDLQTDQNARLTNERALKKVQTLFEGRGRGAELSAPHGTAWGMLCAVTEYIDHERRARNAEYRLESAWFGQGAAIKQRALDHALQLVS